MLNRFKLESPVINAALGKGFIQTIKFDHPVAFSHTALVELGKHSLQVMNGDSGEIQISQVLVKEFAMNIMAAEPGLKETVFGAIGSIAEAMSQNPQGTFSKDYTYNEAVKYIDKHISDIKLAGGQIRAFEIAKSKLQECYSALQCRKQQIVLLDNASKQLKNVNLSKKIKEVVCVEREKGYPQLLFSFILEEENAEQHLDFIVKKILKALKKLDIETRATFFLMYKGKQMQVADSVAEQIGLKNNVK